MNNKNLSIFNVLKFVFSLNALQPPWTLYNIVSGYPTVLIIKLV